MEEVQSWWEVPAISYYCSLLGHGFGLPEFDVKALETSLVTEEALYPELCSVLLQAIDHNAQYNDWRELASAVLDHHDKPNPFKAGQDSELTPWDKLDMLYSLCELRMDCHDVAAILKNIEKWQLKVLVIGEDSNDMLYWYFTGTRIYCQDTSVSERRRTNRRLSRDQIENVKGIRKLACESLLKIHDTPRSNMIKSRSSAVHWSIVTHTYPECLSFTARFENSVEPEEETLYRNLAKVVLPKVKQVVEEEERKMSLAGGGTGLTRSGRKVVARLKNGFVATPKEDTEEEKEENQLTRSSKRRRTQPPKTTTPRHTPLRATRSNSHVEESTPVSKGGRSRGRRPSVACSGKESSPDESQEDSKDEEDNGPVEKIDRRRREHRQRKRSKSIVVSKGNRRPRSEHSTLKDQVDQAITAARDKRRAITPPEGADVELNEALTKVMVALVNHPEAWQFNEPVKEEFAPYYYKLTKNPRDFNQIDKNVIEFKYNSAEAFAEDIHLVFTNCFDYNGPLNEYTRAARILEKYFRRLMREFFDDFSFDDTSVIHPRKRSFVNRHKRIKEIQRGEISSVDESSRDSTDDSHRERRKPGPKPGHRSSTGSKRRTKRKKTEDEQQVSFTDLLSDTYPPQQYQYPYPGYHPGYHGYQYPPHMYHDYHREKAMNNEPTYIELSPARPKAQPQQHFKHDDEPLLFPLLPRIALPRPSLPATSVPEHHMLRLLAEDRPSQINAIDSTTAPGSATTTPHNVDSTTEGATPSQDVTTSEKKEVSSDSTSELSDSKPSDTSADSSVSTSKTEEVSTSKDDEEFEDAKSGVSTTENNVSTSKTENVSTSDKKEDDSKVENCKPAVESDDKEEPKVNGTHTKEPTMNGQSLNNEALSKDSSEASPKKEESKPAADVKPVERPVPAYPTYPGYPSYQGYEAGYPGYPSPNPTYHGSPGGYYSPQYSGHGGGYHPGYHSPAGYHNPAAYQQAYAGYSQYTPGTQYSNGYHPSPLAQQACVTPLNSKQVSMSGQSRSARGRGSRGPRRGRGSRGPRGGGAVRNGPISPDVTSGTPPPSIEDNPWIDPSDGLDEELSPSKKKKEVIDVRMKPRSDKPKQTRTRR